MRIFILLLSFTYIYGGSDIGCIPTLKKHDESECVDDFTIKDTSFVLETLLDEKNITISDTPPRKKIEDIEKLKRVKITEKLDSITVLFQKKSLTIDRVSNKSCPPYCISPMSIKKGVKTFGELETLKFMDSFKTIKNRVLVDTRSVSEYKRGTIPTAVNIPYSMIAPKSKYREEILKILGVKRLKGHWYFKKVKKLLIFDNGILDTRAINTIKSLIKIGYPKNKLIYYRGGFESWVRLGFTVL